MEYRFHLEKEARKPLVAAIGELAGVKPRYLAAPSYGYAIGGCTVDIGGTVTFAEEFDVSRVCVFLKELTDRGFEFEPCCGQEEDGEPDAETESDTVDNETDEAAVGVKGESDGQTETVRGDIEEQSGGNTLTISIPTAGFTASAYTNLDRLVSAKAWILKTMSGAEALPIVRGKNRVSFPWFQSDSDYRTVDAYSRLIAALCETARKKQRVTSVERPAGEGENEKFKARCFLLSLGFIGPELGQARKILLSNFSGNGSHSRGDGKKPDYSSDYNE